MDLCLCVTSCTLYLFQNSFFKFSFLIVNYTRNRSTVWIPLSECRFVKYVFFCLSWYRYYNGMLWLTNVCRQGPSQFELECFFFRLCPYGWYFSAALYQRPSANKNKSVPVNFIFLFLFQLHKWLLVVTRRLLKTCEFPLRVCLIKQPAWGVRWWGTNVKT